MISRVGAAFLLAPLVLAAGSAAAAELPQIKVSQQNSVPACATPGRLMSFLRMRNAKLAPQFEGIATEYMRHGEDLGLRWDIAFFQMLVETGNLTFHGDVDIKQNNFAGLGATGKGESGESFKDVSTGARAHLQHVLMYSGEKVDNPTAERTRKVQEWGVLTSWQKSIKGPMTYKQLAQQWAPKSRKYAHDIESVADSFFEGACKEPDPAPQLVAEARTGRAAPSGIEVADTAAKPAATPDQGKGAEIAKRAIEEQRAQGGERTGLGAGAMAKAAAAAETAAKQPAPSYKIINPEKTETAAAPATAPAAATVAAPAAGATPAISSAGDKPATVQATSAAGSAARAAAPAAAATAKSKCNVFTASYGGQKAIIIKASAPDAVNYTVLDVNDGAEKREADAYIAAYAKGGETVGEFASSDLALVKAFELCPEN